MAKEIFQDNRLGPKFTEKVLDEIMAEGRKYLDHKEWSEAEAAFLKTIKIKPAHAEAHFYMGLVKGSQRLYQEAAKWYEKAAELKPDYAEAHYNLANSLFYIDRHDDALTAYERAIAAYKKLIALNPDDPELYKQLGDAHIDKAEVGLDAGQVKKSQYQKLCQEAIELYQKAVELKPDYAQAYRNLATSLFGLDKRDDAQTAYDKAIAAYKKLLELDPENPELHKQLGEVYTDKGDSRNGIAALKHAIALKPDYFEAYAYLGYAYQVEGDTEAAKRTYKQTTEIKVDPKRLYGNWEAYRISMAYNNLGAIYFDEEDYDQAISCMQKAAGESRELSLGTKSYQRNLAVLYARTGAALATKGEYAEAVAAYKEAIKRFDELQQLSGYLRPWDYIKRQIARGEHSDVIDAFEDFVVRNPEDAEAYYCLARLYSAKGDDSKASEALGKAVRLDSSYQEKAKASKFFVSA